MRTSYSAIETYLQCPQKYKFQELDKIRAPKSREALFGTLIHATLKFIFERNPLFPTLDEALAYFRERWPSRETLDAEVRHDPLKAPWSEEDEKRYFDEGVRMLKRFYEKNAPWNFTVLDLESRFEIALTDQNSGATHILAGIMDRVDKLPDNRYEIIDYKTTRRMPPQSSLENNLQLSLYALGLQKKWPHIRMEDITLSLSFLRHGEKLSAEATEERAHKTKEEILTTIAQIEQKLRDEKIFEPIPGPLCNWCSYRPLCPAWKHLYKNRESSIKDQEMMEETVKEYLRLKKSNQDIERRIAELQKSLIAYMEQEGITRLFDEEGVISQKTLQRHSYDSEKVRAVLEPLGRWFEILEPDSTKLKRLLKELPEEARRALEQAKILLREYRVISVSYQKSSRLPEGRNGTLENKDPV